MFAACCCLVLQEGWAPGTFSSSRAAPAQRKQQSVEDFLDEDELEERQKRGMTLTVSHWACVLLTSMWAAVSESCTACCLHVLMPVTLCSV